MNSNLSQYQPSDESVVVYKSNDGIVQLDVQVADETVWLTLNQLSLLFDRDKSVISRHIHNIYKEDELQYEATVAKIATVQNESGRQVVRQIEYYNLDVIISVGYRVKSVRGVQFRQWASRVLKGFLVIDEDVYHLGASMKDLGKKLFAFSRMEMPVEKIMEE